MRTHNHLLVGGFFFFFFVVVLLTPSWAQTGMHRGGFVGPGGGHRGRVFTGPGGGHRGYTPGRRSPAPRHHYNNNNPYGYGHHPKRHHFGRHSYSQHHYYSYTPYGGSYCPETAYHYHQGYRGAHAHRAPHYRDHHGRHGYARWTPAPAPRIIIRTPYYCQVCGIGFAGEGLFVSHVHRIHDVPYDDVGGACINVGDRVVFDGY